jgi:glycosyltransferase involved in cell wall biosynthesis
MLISYITSHRGKTRDLMRCISSVYVDMVACGIKDYEHLVYLDGNSPDKGIYNSKESQNVRFICSVLNKGKAYCVNRLIDYARGQFLFFLDSDDWNLVGRTSTQLSILSRSQGLLLGSNFLGWNGRSLFFDSRYPEDNRSIKLNFWRYPFLLYSSMCVRKNDLVANGLYFCEQLEGGIDYEFYSRAMGRLEVRNCRDHLVVYRAGNDGGITKNPQTRKVQLSVHKTVMSRMLGLSEERDSHLIEFLFGLVLGTKTTDSVDRPLNALEEFTQMIRSDEIGAGYFRNEFDSEILSDYFKMALKLRSKA